MRRDNPTDGPTDLRLARHALRGHIRAAMLFSLFVNLLMLTGPLYMLQVYDRVLGSGSVETLVTLTGLAAFLYGMMWGLDALRTRIMARAGARFQTMLEPRAFTAMLMAGVRGGNDADAAEHVRDIHAAMASPLAMAVFDIPFVPVFIAGIWLFHPALGMLALAGGALLIAMAVANQLVGARAARKAGRAQAVAAALAAETRGASDTLRACAMQDAMRDAWLGQRRVATASQMAASDASSLFATGTRALRLFLQSAMLGLAAYLVLLGQLSAGAMIAASILMGRALAPVEVAVAHWPLLGRARMAWQGLATALGRLPAARARTALPRPDARLVLRHVAIVPPGHRKAALQGVSCALGPGQALGVIGPSGAGKSTLLSALTGIWPASEGEITLGGARLAQYPPEALARHIGYLPQRVQVFAGSIACNIARLAPDPSPDAVIAAARRAGAHEMILGLPDGYDTDIGPRGVQLSGGQLQRIGLARALFGDPVLLILDEPNSNLDNAGSDAVNAAIRAHKQAGGAAIIVAHRPAAIAECDLLLMLDAGGQRSFGPKADVLGEVVRNHTQIVAAAAGRGAS